MTRRYFPLAAFTAACAVFSAACGVHLEDVPRRALAQTSFVYAADDSVITELHAVEDRVVLPTSQIPDWIRDAAVAIEDRRFYQHHGIDGRAIIRASYVNLRDGSDRGGRLDDHPAAREEPLHGRRTDARSQAQRGLPGVAARRPALQGGDPHPLPEHGVLRTGRLRRAGGRPDVLRRGRPRPHPGPVRPARGSHHQPRALRSVRVPAPSARETPRGPPPDARVRHDHDGPAS